MPCTYYMPGEEREAQEKAYQRVRNELDTATRLLCSVCRSMGRKAAAKHSAELAEWYDKHVEMDERRRGR